MDRSRTLVFFLIAAVTKLCAWPPEAQAEYYLHAWENHRESGRTLSISPSVSRYFSENNYSYQSRLAIPFEFSSYQRIQTDLALAYGIIERLTVYARLSLEWMSLSHESRQGTAYGLADQTAGLNFRVWSSQQGFAVDLQAQIDFPLYSNASAKAANLLFLGDGSYDTGFGAFFTVPAYNGRSYRLRAVAGSGYVLRSALFSAHVPYAFHLTVEPLREGLVASTGISGFQSMKNDASGNSGLDYSGSEVSSGGSFI
ncbi:MAG: hypothetical protein AAB425_03390, partial [Bdellovibrionota bacterium]